MTQSLLIFFVIERSVLMALVFYNKGMLEKVTKQRLNSAQLSYFFGAKRVQLNAEISLFLKNHSLEFLAHGS